MVQNSAGDSSPSDGGSKAILFIFTCCATGALVRTIVKKIPLPYTVYLLLLGAITGLIANEVTAMRSYTTMADLDPHTILFVFMPILIFESAFSLEAHTFLKSFIQIITLAIPGFISAAFLTALFARYVFAYEGWGWSVSMMFGAINSATDPVAVVALLKELGASKQLGMLIEGESLLNDGAAIVAFEVCKKMSLPGQSMSAAEIAIYFIRVTLGGPVFGFIMAKIFTFWLVNIFNDALTEITITLAAAYLTFYIGEAWLMVSGVLAVVALGVTMSAERTSISPEVETFLHRFWEMLAYLANTLIFILVGLVITMKATPGTLKDWALMFVFYVVVNFIRGIIIALYSPLLKRVGYGLNWRSGTIMMWGGLRGAVGLLLALIVQHEAGFPDSVKSKVLLHTAGLVMMTLLINATTIGKLLALLGMSEISAPKRMAMASAVRTLRDVTHIALNAYKSDRFLADADWDVVSQHVKIQDPYHTTKEEAELEDLTTTVRLSKCPGCEKDVPVEPTKAEFEEMRNEARLRLLKAEKTSYWKQFEHGMLSREAVRKLVECVDNANDRENGFVDINEIKKSWKIKGIFAAMKQKLVNWRSGKGEKNEQPPPTNKLFLACYKICNHQVFEIIMYIIIFSNVIVIIFELVEEANLCTAELYQKYGSMFEIFNYVFLGLYLLEAFFKILGYRVQYFKNHWNQFDFVIVLLSVVDVVLSLTLPEEDNCSVGVNFFSPSVLKIGRVFRLLRFLRSIRLVKALIPQVIEFLNGRINKQLRFGYDVGKGYIMGEEEVHNFVDHMIDNKKIAVQLKEHVVNGRLEILKELGSLQKDHPGIAVSVKTQQAGRRILNNVRDRIIELRGDGVLDETESAKLEIMVETRIKKLLKLPSYIEPPPPEKVILHLSWLEDDAQLRNYIKRNAELVMLCEGDTVMSQGDPRGGLYIIVNGLVRVESEVEDFSDTLIVRNDRGQWVPSTRHRKQSMRTNVRNVLRSTDYLSTSNVLGEMALLTGKSRNARAICETGVQMYHISYEAMQGAMDLFTEQPSLEYRLWRVAAIRIAATVLRNYQFYQSWNAESIQLYLEKSVLFLKKGESTEGENATGSDTTFFDINSICMSDIVLIHGLFENAATKEKYIGPSHIPNGQVAKLNLLSGYSEKHCILIVPRGSNNLKQGSKGSATSISAASTIAANASAGAATESETEENSNKTLCLAHASKHRLDLQQKISDAKLQASKSNLAIKLSNSLLSSNVVRRSPSDKKNDAENQAGMNLTNRPKTQKPENFSRTEHSRMETESKDVRASGPTREWNPLSPENARPGPLPPVEIPDKRSQDGTVRNDQQTD